MTANEQGDRPRQGNERFKLIPSDDGNLSFTLLHAGALLGIAVTISKSSGGGVCGTEELEFLDRVSLDGLRALSPVCRANFAVGVLGRKRGQWKINQRRMTNCELEGLNKPDSFFDRASNRQVVYSDLPKDTFGINDK